jgi:hypothetical protein
MPAWSSVETETRPDAPRLLGDDRSYRNAPLACRLDSPKAFTFCKEQRLNGYPP